MGMKGVWVTVRTRIMRHPIVALICLSILAFFGYYGLMQFAWFQKVAGFIATVISAEYGIVRLHAEGKSFLTIVFLVYLGDMINLFIDLFLVNRLIHWQWSSDIIQTCSNWGKALGTRFRQMWQRVQNGQHNVSGSTGNGNAIERLQEQVRDLHANPSKGTIGMIFLFGLIPRIPPLPGTVSVAVLIIRYNHMGLAGWLSLLCGMSIRHGVVLASVFGIGSLF